MRFLRYEMFSRFLVRKIHKSQLITSPSLYNIISHHLLSRSKSEQSFVAMVCFEFEFLGVYITPPPRPLPTPKKKAKRLPNNQIKNRVKNEVNEITDLKKRTTSKLKLLKSKEVINIFTCRSIELLGSHSSLP